MFPCRCSGESELVEYWNRINSALEVQLHFLGNLASEATQVHAHNPWCTYGEPLHRLRGLGFGQEMGAAAVEVDLLNRRPLTARQVRLLCTVV